MLDWLNFFLFFINFWWPWVNILNEFLVLQFLILYLIYVVYSVNNLYFLLFYIFFLFIYFGIFLSIFNLELFTAFLWLTECVIIFVSILFLFYFNVYNNKNKDNNIIYSFKYYGLFIFLFIFSLNLIFFYEFEFYSLSEFQFFFLQEDYYEALFNNKMNDLFGLYISYYFLNSFELLIVGFLLLIASLVCVNLNKFFKNIKSNNYFDLLTLFEFFNDFTKFLFLRKQNLTEQFISTSSTRFFKKKLKNNF